MFDQNYPENTPESHLSMKSLVLICHEQDSTGLPVHHFLPTINIFVKPQEPGFDA